MRSIVALYEKQTFKIPYIHRESSDNDTECFVKTGWWFVLEDQSVDSRCLTVIHCTELMILPVGRQLLLASRHW